MMAIISDVHGNYPALKAVLDDIEQLGCHQIISLGDIAGYYCMVNECIELLRERDVISVMGNHDYYLISNTQCPRSNAANQCLDYQRQVIKQENLKWLQDLPLRLAIGDISMVHAGWKDPLDEYIERISANYFANFSEKYFFSGHTHVQLLYPFGEKIYCNPGSVGQPRDGDWRAAYAIFDYSKVILRRISYPVDDIATAMQHVGFASYFYKNLYNGTRLGGNITTVSMD